MRATLIGLSMIALLQTACSRPAEPVTAAREGDQYSITMRSDDLRGRCYAPQSFSANGSLVIVDLPKGKSLNIERVRREAIEGLGDILMQPRSRTNGDAVTVDFPRDSVLQHPSYLQLVIFDCRATPSNPAPQNNLFILSARVDLP